MALNIPNVVDSGEALSRGFETGLGLLRSRREAQLMPYQMELAKAQAKEAQTNALKSEMFANILKSAAGGSQDGTGQYGQVGQPGQGNMSALDIAATAMGYHVQPIQADGKMYIYNPLAGGLREVGKTGETKAETSKRELGEKMQYQTWLSGMKTGEQIESKVPGIMSIRDKINQAKEIYSRRPDLGGLTIGKLAEYGIGDEDVGKLNKIFGDLQVDIAKLGSQRGGIGALKWAQNIKAALSKQVPFNIGILDETLRESDVSLNDLSKLYNKKTGKNLFHEMGLQEPPSEEKKLTLEDKYKTNKEVKKLTQEGKLSKTEGRQLPQKTEQPEGKIGKVMKFGNKDYVKINNDWHEVIR